MSSRVIRDQILESESLEGVSLGAELLFWRLILYVDDFGRCKARAKILAKQLFPLRDISEEQLDCWLEELAHSDGDSGCIELYEVDGQRYLQLSAWEKHVSKQRRSTSSRFPGPEDASGPAGCTSPEIPGDPRRSPEIPGDPGRSPEIPSGVGVGVGVGVGEEEEGESEGEEESAPAGARRRKSKRASPEISTTARELTRGFLDSIKAPFPDFRDPSPSAYARWELEMDRMLRLDPERTPERVIEISRWLFDPSPRASPDAVFWRANIQSVPKLREKWDRLWACRERQNGTRQRATVQQASKELLQDFDRHHRRHAGA